MYTLFAIDVHSFRDRCTLPSHYIYTPFEVNVATVSIDLVSIYIDLVGEERT